MDGFACPESNKANRYFRGALTAFVLLMCYDFGGRWHVTH